MIWTPYVVAWRPRTYDLRRRRPIVKWIELQKFCCISAVKCNFHAADLPKGRHRVRCPVSFASMMTSSNGNIFRATGHLCGEFTGHRWIPRKKASDAELWWFLWLVYKRLSKQLWSWWFETPSYTLWHHCNGLVICALTVSSLYCVENLRTLGRVVTGVTVMLKWISISGKQTAQWQLFFF